MRHFCSLMVLLLVSACTTQKNIQPETPDWRFEGKLSYSTSVESQVVNIRWEQTGDQSHIRLSGPFGFGSAEVNANPQGFTLLQKGKRTYYPSDTAITWTDNQDPLVLPWESMAGWIRGRGGTDLTEGDWQVEVLDATETGPKLISITHPSVRLRVSIREWL